LGARHVTSVAGSAIAGVLPYVFTGFACAKTILKEPGLGAFVLMVRDLKIGSPKTTWFQAESNVSYSVQGLGKVTCGVAGRMNVPSFGGAPRALNLQQLPWPRSTYRKVDKWQCVFPHISTSYANDCMIHAT
jgi:hypothetical protein